MVSSSRRAVAWAVAFTGVLVAAPSAAAVAPATVVQTCAPAAITTSEVSHCTATVANTATSPANVHLAIAGAGLDYSNASGSAVASAGGVDWTGTLAAATGPGITSVAVGPSPVGYLGLAGFGIPPIGGIGDDTVTDFNVPTFFYAGEPYTKVGVSSNGYAVVGGSTGSADNSFVVQTFPNPAKPNNVLAPFWTDMNPPAGGAIRIGVLTDGANQWLVIDWAAVKNFSDANTHTFEIWARLTGGPTGNGRASEDITYAYATSGPGNPKGSNWGAENRDGSSGANIASQPANGSSYRVNTTPPVPGGTEVITYDVTAKAAGSYTSAATATSNLSGESSSSPQPITVSKSGATLTLDEATLNQTFDGSPRPVTATTDPAGLEGVHITYNGSDQAPSNPGTYDVVASLDNPGYSASDVIGTLVIAAAAAPVDRTSPETSIDSGPAKETAKLKAKFAFSSSEPGSSFECKLDKGRWTGCDSPAKFKKLEPGRHKFRVRATDPSGNLDSSPAKLRWRIKP